MSTPWMFVTGCTIISFLAPEILVATCKVRVPWMMNVLCAMSGGLIAGAFV